MIRAFATVGGYTGLSRILGFIRDILIADVVGTGPVADAFFVAFRLPNLFRRTFAEGAFNAAFVPLFARRLEQEGEAAAKFFAEEALSVLLTALLLLTAVAMAAMPYLIEVLAPGFGSEPEKFALTVELSRITFPYLLFMSLTALYSGLLNSLYRFAAAAAAPVLLNMLFIGALVMVLPFVGSAGHVMAWTVAAAGLAQVFLLIIASRRAGMELRLRAPRWTAGIRRLLALMVPGITSAGVLQINLLVGTIIASWQAGAVSYLYYADRIYQLPLGMIGIAFGVVLLPDLARKLRSGADAAAQERLNRGLEYSLLLTLPAAVALIVVPLPIVVVLFERGALIRESSEAISWALMAFAAGLPAFVLVKVLQPAFFAREDTVTPLKFAAVSVAANIVLSFALFFYIEHVGIALATSLSSWLNVGLLAWSLKHRSFLNLDERLRARLPRILLASLLMGVALWGAVAWWLAPWFDGQPWLRIAALIILVSGGLGIYGGLAYGMGAVRRADLQDLLRRRPAAPQGSGSDGP